VPLSAVDAISPAFQHTKQQLIQPFSSGQWAKLALVGFLAGEMSSYGCSGPSNFQMPHNHSNQFAASSMPNVDPTVYVSLIVGLIIAGLVLGILFVYISSVMRFVLFDSIVNRTCEIRRSWRVRHAAGLRFFFWNICVSLAMIAGMVILIGIPVALAFALGWTTHPKEHLLPLILGGIALFFLFFILFLTFLIVHVMTKDFVVPQMALENITALEGWRRLWPRMKAEKGSFAGYMAMKVVMALGAAMLLGIVTVIILLIVLIPVGGMGAIAVLGGKAAGLVWDLYTISTAVVVGWILLAVILYIISFISVPAIVFFPAYSIYFFADRYPPLHALLHAAPPAPLPDPFQV
jgi:MFS family permease